MSQEEPQNVRFRGSNENSTTDLSSAPAAGPTEAPAAKKEDSTGRQKDATADSAELLVSDLRAASATVRQQAGVRSSQEEAARLMALRDSLASRRELLLLQWKDEHGSESSDKLDAVTNEWFAFNDALYDHLWGPGSLSGSPTNKGPTEAKVFSLQDQQAIVRKVVQEHEKAVNEATRSLYCTTEGKQISAVMLIDDESARLQCTLSFLRKKDSLAQHRATVRDLISSARDATKARSQEPSDAVTLDERAWLRYLTSLYDSLWGSASLRRSGEDGAARVELAPFEHAERTTYVLKKLRGALRALEKDALDDAEEDPQRVIALSQEYSKQTQQLVDEMMSLGSPPEACDDIRADVAKVESCLSAVQRGWMTKQSALYEKLYPKPIHPSVVA